MRYSERRAIAVVRDRLLQSGLEQTIFTNLEYGKSHQGRVLGEIDVGSFVLDKYLLLFELKSNSHYRSTAHAQLRRAKRNKHMIQHDGLSGYGRRVFLFHVYSIDGTSDSLNFEFYRVSVL